jgi:hypothetical protein
MSTQFKDVVPSPRRLGSRTLPTALVNSKKGTGVLFHIRRQNYNHMRMTELDQLSSAQTPSILMRLTDEKRCPHSSSSRSSALAANIL